MLKSLLITTFWFYFFGITVAGPKFYTFLMETFLPYSFSA